MRTYKRTYRKPGRPPAIALDFEPNTIVLNISAWSRYTGKWSVSVQKVGSTGTRGEEKLVGSLCIAGLAKLARDARSMVNRGGVEKVQTPPRKKNTTAPGGTR